MCGFNTLVVYDNVAEFDPDDCPWDCMRPCEKVCPANAILQKVLSILNCLDLHYSCLICYIRFKAYPCSFLKATSVNIAGRSFG